MFETVSQKQGNVKFYVSNTSKKDQMGQQIFPQKW